MERTRRNVGYAIADARAERGEPVPELTLERNTTLRADGAGSRNHEVIAEEQADGSETLQVTVRDPEAKAKRTPRSLQSESPGRSRGHSGSSASDPPIRDGLVDRRLPRVAELDLGQNLSEGSQPRLHARAAIRR